LSTPGTARCSGPQAASTLENARPLANAQVNRAGAARPRSSCATIAAMATVTVQSTRRSMGWVIFVAGAVLSWGAYGALLHMGQTQLGNPLKALLCVGVAYFLIGVII